MMIEYQILTLLAKHKIFGTPATVIVTAPSFRHIRQLFEKFRLIFVNTRVNVDRCIVNIGETKVLFMPCNMVSRKECDLLIWVDRNRIPQEIKTECLTHEGYLTHEQ